MNTTLLTHSHPAASAQPLALSRSPRLQSRFVTKVLIALAGLCSAMPLPALSATTTPWPTLLNQDQPLQGVPSTRGVPGSSMADSDWHYRVRPNESLWAIASRFLKPSLNWSDLLAYNQLPSATEVTAGSLLRIPMDWLKNQPSPVIVETLTGMAWYRRHHESVPRPLAKGIHLNVGDELRTGNGHLLLRFADGSSLRVGTDTQLTFNRLTTYGQTGMADTQIRLETGKISTRVKPLGDAKSRFEIRTPSAVAAVRGTGFRLQSRPEATQLEVTEGQVYFAPQDKLSDGITAQAGTALRFDTQVARLTRFSMLGAPVVQAGGREAHELPVTLTWEPIAGASHYLYQVFDQDAQDALVEEAYTREPKIALFLQRNGHYRLALTAIDAHGIAGFTHSVAIHVQLQAQAAQLLAPEMDQALTLDLPEFHWRMPNSGEVARLELSQDPDFHHWSAASEYAQDESTLPDRRLLPGQYFWRVRTQLGNDSETVSEVRHLRIVEMLPPVKINQARFVDGEALLSWHGLPGVTAYQLEIAQDAAFSVIIKREMLDHTNAQVVLTPGKTYYARLTPVPTGFYISRAGPGYRLSLPLTSH